MRAFRYKRLEAVRSSKTERAQRFKMREEILRKRNLVHNFMQEKEISVEADITPEEKAQEQSEDQSPQAGSPKPNGTNTIPK